MINFRIVLFLEATLFAVVQWNVREGGLVGLGFCPAIGEPKGAKGKTSALEGPLTTAPAAQGDLTLVFSDSCSPTQASRRKVRGRCWNMGWAGEPHFSWWFPLPSQPVS